MPESPELKQSGVRAVSGGEQNVGVEKKPIRLDGPGMWDGVGVEAEFADSLPGFAIVSH